MKLKDFQLEKIEELFSFTKDNYEQSNKTAYLKAPTGSGKTIILGNYIKKRLNTTYHAIGSYRLNYFLSKCNDTDFNIKENNSITYISQYRVQEEKYSKTEQKITFPERDCFI